MHIAHPSFSRGTYEILEDIAVIEDETSFDRAEMNIVFWGSEQQLRSRFPKGSDTNYPGVSSSAGKMVCSGIEIQRNRFGFVWARVKWLGMVNPPSGITPGGGRLQMIGSTALLSVRGMTNNGSTHELMLPQTTASGTTITAGSPYNSTSRTRSRTRIIGDEWSSNYTGLLIVRRTAPPAMPRLLGRPRPTGLDSTFNNATAGSTAAALSQSNWFAGINTADSGGGGWCTRNFTARSTLILGEWMMMQWEATAAWVDRFSAA